MNRKIRYSILAAGAAAFVVLAPIIILYVRGISFNFKTRQFTATGILALRSEPKEAKVFLDNKLTREDVSDIKFLLPGEYEVALKKPGYYDWSKRLKIEAGQVTWGNPINGKIYLLRDTAVLSDVATGVMDFYFKNGLLTYLSQDALVLASGSRFSEKRTFVLPEKAEKIAEVKDNRFLLERGGQAALLFNSDTGIFTPLYGIFATGTEWSLLDNGDLLALNGGILYKVNAQNSQKVKLFENIKTFSVLDSSLYLIEKKPDGIFLTISQEPFNQSQQILNGLPEFAQGSLLVTRDKRVFLVAEKKIYLAAETMKKIAENVSSFVFDSDNSTLLVFYSGEFGYYQDGSGLSLVSRSSETLNSLGLSKNIGYGFYANSRGLNGIELDLRDRQNQYLLYPSQTIQKFTLDRTGENIVLLDSGNLKTLNIR